MAISEAAVRVVLAVVHGEVGRYLGELAGRGADIARGLVPRRSGRMMETITSGTDRDPFTLAVRGWFGAGYNADPPAGSTWSAGFPVINALEARRGYVWNRSPHGERHVRGVRRAEPFLDEALDLLTAE
jgi:hypothetical protein